MSFTLLIFSIILSVSHTLPQGDPNEAPQCSSFESSGYHCVPYYLCDAKGYIVTDGGGIFNPRTAEQSDTVQVVNHNDALQSSCEKLIHVCCRHPSTKDTDVTHTTSKPLAPNPKTVPPKPRCGNRNRNGVGVRNGNQLPDEEAQFGEWPHVCAVLKEEELEEGEKVNIYQCAGSLISKGAVLTAAHCVSKESGATLIVRCGEWDTLSENESKPHQERIVQETFIHPNFTAKNLHNNFAILVTEADFDVDDHISPVCLPSPKDETKPKDCVSNGWGKDQFGSKGEYQTKLKEIQLPIVPNSKCQEQLRETRLGRFFELDDSFMCAGGGDADTCKGDGGGPLTCRHEGSSTYTQVGIVSWGIGCGQNDVPAVYADVAKAACWIDKTVSCHLEKELIDTFESTSSFVPSLFGFTIEDCPKEFAPGPCPDDGSKNDDTDDYEPYDYDAREGDDVESDIFDTL